LGAGTSAVNGCGQQWLHRPLIIITTLQFVGKVPKRCRRSLP
jgi:hypothetical protein